MKTKELIQELAGLCFDKGIDFEYYKSGNWHFFSVDSENMIHLEGNDANQQLLNAIEQVREL